MENKGFTIIELVIAIFILSVAVIGVYSSFSAMVILTSNVSDRLTAAYLAQEGMEIVRNIRDTNWIKGDDWKYGLENCTVGCQGNYATMGTVSSPLSPYVNGYLYINNSNGFYDHNISGTKTKFKRKITVSSLAGFDYIVKVSVQVFWDQKPTILNPAGDPGVIEAEENLYNWY